MEIIELVSSEFIYSNDFCNKKLKKLYPDMYFISHFIRNTSDLNLKMLFLICGTILMLKAQINKRDINL